MNKNLKLVFVAILVIAIAGGYFFPNVTERVIERLGALPGPDIYDDIFIHNALNTCPQRGNFATSTGAGAADTLRAVDLGLYNRIEYDQGPAGDGTLTIQATSSWTTLLPNAGDSCRWWIDLTGTSTQATTLAAGTGIILLETDGDNIIFDGGESVPLWCSRNSSDDVECLAIETQDAD